MDQSMWQTIISFDLLHSSYLWIQTVLPCGNTAKQCRLGLFQGSEFVGDLEDSKSTSGGTLCICESHTFVPISWMGKKQTAVSHSSTESEIISLDAGLRMDGLPAIDLWDVAMEVSHSSNNVPPTENPKANPEEPRETAWETMSITSGWRKKVTETLMSCQIKIMWPQTHIFFRTKLSCTFWKIAKLWSRWSSKDEVRW